MKLGKIYKYPNGDKFVGFKDLDDNCCIVSQWSGSIAILVQSSFHQTVMRINRKQAKQLAEAIMELVNVDA